MKAIIVGAGVIGMATAYYLVRKGIEVEVIDQYAAAGEGTSKGNGAQLCYNYVAPLAGPGVLGKLPKWLSDPNSPVRFEPKLDLHQWNWCLQFVRRCNQRASQVTTVELLKLSMLSSRLMEELRPKVPLSFDFSNKGKLVVYSSEASFSGAKRQLDLQRAYGCVQEAISVDRCMEIEPALARMRSKLVGAIFTPGDHTADAHLFCKGMADYLTNAYPTFRLQTNTRVESILVKGKQATGVETASGSQFADHIVLATGVETNTLLKTARMVLPIYPIRGYSITVPVRQNERMPEVSITDYDERIVYAPIGERLRVAGIADIGGYSNEIKQGRIALLAAEARKNFAISPAANLSPWCGLRPATPAGTPICGESKLKCLYLNVGHGGLGWTLALATGFQVANKITATIDTNS